jgi:tRNA pseudouridine38-40 synthase
MLSRYFFRIAYKGANYYGWQRQPKQISVQEVIECELEKLFRQKIAIVGCGRTDTGVHASDFYFHCDLPKKFDASKLLFKLNRMFPSDIVVKDIQEVNLAAHARFDAELRSYHYRIHTFKSAFSSDESTYIPQALDFEKMNLATQYLLGKKDFTSFSKLHTDVKTNICEVYSAKWIQVDSQNWYFEISANRFLRNMVRAIVGTLFDVGMDKIAPEDVSKIIEAKNRGAAGKSVPAHGLYLSRIEYPKSLFVTEN